MREMGTVELLTREGEIEIAKRIEEGLNQVKIEAVRYPPSLEKLIEVYARVAEGETRMQDFVVDFIDPNAPDEIQSPMNKPGEVNDKDSDEEDDSDEEEYEEDSDDENDGESLYDEYGEWDKGTTYYDTSSSTSSGWYMGQGTDREEHLHEGCLLYTSPSQRES